MNLVLADGTEIKKRRELLVAALEQSRRATLLLLQVLSERDVGEKLKVES